MAAGNYDLAIQIGDEHVAVPESVRVEVSGGVDTVLVIDCSDSMAGAKITAARSAARQFVELLQPGNRVGVVAFDTSASLVFPLTLD